MRGAAAISLLLAALVSPSVAAGQTPSSGSAVLLACTAIETCGDAGTCILAPEQLWVVETRLYTDAGIDELFYLLGPQGFGVGGGVFYSYPVETRSGDFGAAAMLDRWPDDPDLGVIRQIGSDGRNRYGLRRPARDVPGLSGNVAVTVFECAEEVFP